MKTIIFALSLLSCATASALLPQDDQRMMQMKAELKHMEEQASALHTKISEMREKIAREHSAAVVREVENNKKTIGM